MTTIIKLDNVTLKNRGKTTLQNIDFAVEKGEEWAIIGLNGSGKTSLLNVIAGYQFPAAGTVQVLGETYGDTNLPELRRKIGFVSNSLERFSDYYRNERIESIIASGKYASFGLYEPLQEEDWQTVDEWLEKFGLMGYKGQALANLSEGEKRRVLIARAMMNEPEILLLDEPCSGLDILAKEQFLTSLRSVTEEGCHVIYVTHHIDELIPEITHVLLLDDGKVVAKGPKEEILTDGQLSKTFHIPVTVEWEDERPIVKVRRRS